MVAAKPSTVYDLDRTRTHNWSRDEPRCIDCGVVMDENWWMMNLWPCPGPLLVPCTAKHCKDHSP